jgi:hypothetical protein
MVKNTEILTTNEKINKIDVNREVRELKTHLSYSKNIGFFFGAGTSCALEIPNVEQLTDEIKTKLSK